MHLPQLQDKIGVLTALIKSMDDLHDLGMQKAIPLEELQRIYGRIKALKSARGELLRKRKQVRRDILHCSNYQHLLQAARERVMN